MGNMIRAQFSERWLKTRKTIFIAAVMMPILSILFFNFLLWVLHSDGASPDWMTQQEYQESIGIFRMAILIGFLFAAIGVGRLSSLQDRPQDLLGFPAHQFLRPLPTYLLVACPLLYNFCLAAFLYAFAATIYSWSTNMRLPSTGFMMLFAGTCSVAVHMADWSVAGLLRRSFCMVIVMALLGSWLLSCADFYNPMRFFQNIPAFTWQDYAFLLACCATAYAVALWNVARHRRGERITFPNALTWYPSFSHTFRSPAHALFWFDFMRSGFGLAILNGILLITIFAITPCIFWLAKQTPDTETIAVFWIIYAALSFFVLSLLAPFSIAGLSAAGKKTPSSFEMTCPISVRTMAKVKILAAICSVSLAWILVIPVAWIYTALWGNDVLFQDLAVDARDIMVLFIIGLCAVVAAWTHIGATMSVFFSARQERNLSKRVQNLSFLIIYLIVGGIALFLWDQMTGQRLEILWQIAASAIGLILIASVCIVLYFARKQNYLSKRGLIVAISLWTLFFIVIATSYALSDLHESFLGPRHALPYRFMWSCYLILPLAPPALVPLSLARLRHQ